LPALAVQYAPRLGYRTEISFVLAAVYQALGQADRAREIVDAVCEHLLRTGNSPALFRAQAYQAELALRQGRVDEAREWARNFDPGPVQLVYRFFNAPHLTLARVWIAEGSAENREQAGRLLQLLQADLAARHNIRFLIEVLALQALLQYALRATKWRPAICSRVPLPLRSPAASSGCLSTSGRISCRP
jgi:ATP/maltotriose-dependent transcriptional regulator MalT